MAVYFCTGALKDEKFFCHYALNVPLYTHFTSPIRRYADVIVHRLLAASIGELILLSQGAYDYWLTECNVICSSSTRGFQRPTACSLDESL